MLQKQIEKEKKKNAAAETRKKGTVHANKGEFIDRKKQRFDISATSMLQDGDFDFGAADAVDPHPKFSENYLTLQKKDEFLLTMNDQMIMEDPDDSEEGENNVIMMVHRANTHQKTHFKGLSSAGGMDS